MGSDDAWFEAWNAWVERGEEPYTGELPYPPPPGNVHPTIGAMRTAAKFVPFMRTVGPCDGIAMRFHRNKRGNPASFKFAQMGIATLMVGRTSSMTAKTRCASVTMTFVSRGLNWARNSSRSRFAFRRR